MAWKYKIDIKQFLTDDDIDDITPQQVKAVSKKLADYLSQQSLEQGFTFPKELSNKIKRTSNVDTFNRLLGDVYDWADENRIWCG